MRGMGLDTVMARIAINGRFVARDLTGQERFAFETVRELDGLLQEGDDVVVVVPEYADEQKLSFLKNIKVEKVGQVRSHFWEQISFSSYLRKSGRQPLNLCATCPICAPGWATIYDVAEYKLKEKSHNLYARLSRVWHRLMHRAIKKRADKVLTISRYSYNELRDFLGIDEGRLVLIGCGWQHMNRIAADDSVLNEHPELIKMEYYLSVSSITPQKNFKWVREVAKRNKNSIFAVAGKKSGLSSETIDSRDEENIVYLGYVSDEQLRSLMENAKAFLHPALYEGFGMTPLEALSVGSDLIISTATCLPEIYGDSAHYIDPYDYDVDLADILAEPVGSKDDTLARHSWKRNAEVIYDLIRGSSSSDAPSEGHVHG